MGATPKSREINFRLILFDQPMKIILYLMFVIDTYPTISVLFDLCLFFHIYTALHSSIPPLKWLGGCH